MGWNYRKSVKLPGGVRINFSKSGVGYSVGGKGYRVTKSADGTVRKTYSVPGTGISYTETDTSGRRRRQEEARAVNQTEVAAEESPRISKPFYKKAWFWVVIVLTLFLFSEVGETQEQIESSDQSTSVIEAQYITEE